METPPHVPRSLQSQGCPSWWCKAWHLMLSLLTLLSYIDPKTIAVAWRPGCSRPLVCVAACFIFPSSSWDSSAQQQDLWPSAVIRRWCRLSWWSHAEHCHLEVASKSKQAKCFAWICGFPVPYEFFPPSCFLLYSGVKITFLLRPVHIHWWK